MYLLTKSMYYVIRVLTEQVVLYTHAYQDEEVRITLDQQKLQQNTAMTHTISYNMLYQSSYHDQYESLSLHIGPKHSVEPVFSWTIMGNTHWDVGILCMGNTYICTYVDNIHIQ